MICCVCNLANLPSKWIDAFRAQNVEFCQNEIFQVFFQVSKEKFENSVKLPVASSQIPFAKV